MYSDSNQEHRKHHYTELSSLIPPSLGFAAGFFVRHCIAPDNFTVTGEIKSTEKRACGQRTINVYWLAGNGLRGLQEDFWPGPCAKHNFIDERRAADKVQSCIRGGLSRSWFRR